MTYSMFGEHTHINPNLLAPEVEQMLECHAMENLRAAALTLRSRLMAGEFSIVDSEGCPKLASVIQELTQIAESHTLERAAYYAQRLSKGLTQVRTSSINDINLRRWKDYDDIITDSLWLLDKRDSTGVHTAGYWGNFIPQIPNQMMKRYTKAGNWVLDPFAGSGTTLIEAQRLGRNSIGIELQPEVAEAARNAVQAEPNPHGVAAQVVKADSTAVDYHALLSECGVRAVQLAVLHPPYHDIITFSEDPRDLCNAPSVDSFLDMLGEVVKRTAAVLDSGRYLALVIGDKFAGGEWIPLGFLAMDRIRGLGFQLRSTIVKNFDQTAGKRGQQQLWRYRAIAGGNYVFKHEYIFVFRKI